MKAEFMKLKSGKTKKVQKLRQAKALLLLLSIVSPAVGLPVQADEASLNSMNEVARIRQKLNQTKDTNAALDELQDLIKREPNNVEAHMLCGKVLTLLGYEGLADDQFKIADKLDPSQPDSVLSLFHNKLQKDGPMAAYEYLRYVQKRFPKDPSVLIMQGLMERVHGNEAKAEFYYRDAMDKNPDTPGIATALASLKLSQKRYKEAVKIAEHDLKLKNEYPTANLAKGQALMHMGRFAEAIPYLRTALKGVADQGGVADVLSRALICNGQYGEAIYPTLVVMSRISMKDRNKVNMLKQRLYFILGKVDAAELLNSLQMIRREITFQEKMASLYFASGDVLDKTGHANEALEAFEAGIKLYEYSGRPFLRVGIIKENQRDYQGAFKSYEKAYSLSPNDREVAARLLRLLKRAPAQQKDLAWKIKDLVHGGRVSLLYKPKPN